MRTMGTCDLCNGKISQGEGYAFYSATIPPFSKTETGSMHVCDACTDKWINKQQFNTSLSMDPITAADFSNNQEEAFQWLQKANAYGAIALCKAHKLTPAEARTKARELSLLLWRDKNEGARQTEKFWTSVESKIERDKPERKETVEEEKQCCHICSEEKPTSEGKKYSPRTIQNLELKSDQAEARATKAFAHTMGNTQDLLDTPLWWICTSCMSRCFGKPNDQTAMPASQASNGGCFIATACYGNFDCPEVMTLRRFRDDTLLHTYFGRLFIIFYYMVSPSIARCIVKHKSVSLLIRHYLLSPVVSKLDRLKKKVA